MDLLIELLSEEIPARMQARAREDLKRLITGGLVEAGLTYASAGAFSTPRRLALAIEGLTAESKPVREERKGPRTDAPEKAIEGFLRSTGLTLDQLERRAEKKGEAFYAVVERPGRPAAPELRKPDESETGEPLTGLALLKARDPSFDVSGFLNGARAAYDMIVTAFAAGDRRQLKNLLGREVYDGFEAAIKDREQRGETVESRFVSIDSADLIGAEVRGKTAQVTVRFHSQLVSVTRDKQGAVIDGNPDKVTDVTDVWTFARDVASRDPNWKLVATEAGQ